MKIRSTRVSVLCEIPFVFAMFWLSEKNDWRYLEYYNQWNNHRRLRAEVQYLNALIRSSGGNLSDQLSPRLMMKSCQSSAGAICITICARRLSPGPRPAARSSSCRSCSTPPHPPTRPASFLSLWPLPFPSSTPFITRALFVFACPPIIFHFSTISCPQPPPIYTSWLFICSAVFRLSVVNWTSR